MALASRNMQVTVCTRVRFLFALFNVQTYACAYLGIRRGHKDTSEKPKTLKRKYDKDTARPLGLVEVEMESVGEIRTPSGSGTAGRPTKKPKTASSSNPQKTTNLRRSTRGKDKSQGPSPGLSSGPVAAALMNRISECFFAVGELAANLGELTTELGELTAEVAEALEK